MKPVQPVERYEEDRYPSDREAGVTRRGLLRIVLGSVGAAAVGAAVGTTIYSDEAEARRGRKLPGVARRPKRRAVFDLTPDHKLSGCKLAVASVTVLTYNHSLLPFIRDKKERAGIHKAVVQVLKKHTCKDVNDAKRRYKLQRKVATALAQLFYKRKKIAAGYVWIYLSVVPTAKS